MESENFDLESGGWLSTSQESPSERSEKQKESSKRAQAQLQKIQKDEKKAKGDNDDLFQILSRFIQNPLYDVLVPRVTLLLEKTYSSRFIMTVVALVSPEAAHFLLEAIGKGKLITEVIHLHHSEIREKFHEDTTHTSIRSWISTWINTSQEFLTKDTSSVVLSQKLSLLLASPDRRYASEALTEFFTFFFDMRNIDIDEKKSRAYADFILWELQKSLTKHLETADTDLRSQENVDTNTLFGI